MFDDSDGIVKQFEMYDNISEFIHSFEEQKKKKKENKIKGIEKFLKEEIEILTDNT